MSNSASLKIVNTHIFIIIYHKIKNILPLFKYMYIYIDVKNTKHIRSF
jgi:hypothetical protein